MVTFTEAPPRSTMISFPTREEIRAAMTDRAVFITVIICGTLFALAALGGMVALAMTGHEYAAIAATLSAVFGPLLAALGSRLKAMHETIKTATTQGGTTDGGTPSS